MNNQDVVAFLEECRRALDVLPSKVSLGTSEEDQAEYQRCEDLLPDDLRTLIQEAKEMKWPFVPERWQYKQAVRPEDKINLQDLIGANLHELLVYLKASITVREYATAAAVVFLVDRFLYWVDASRKLLQVAKCLHKQCPTTPIAPQVVIRQARVSVNSGKLLKAEYILGSLIRNSGGTGTWSYAEESDKMLVQSVCIQIRGQILQKLGLWYEAAELIWASIVGFFELPTPDKKGIASSLGILADILVSMSDEDYQKFKSNPQIDLSLLNEFDHRLLSAAEACKLAAVYSLYTPLFVLTSVNIRGTCLLSYSFSNQCSAEKRMYYLSEAQEAFEIGLLINRDADSFTSKQQLHSLVKAAFCLTTVHKWRSGESDELCEVRRLCSEAMEKLYMYSQLPEKQDKSAFAKEIMSLVTTVTKHLQVQSFPNSDERSYVPDSYRECERKSIFNGRVSFKEIIELYSQHHASVCQAFENICRNHKIKDEPSATGVCITALKTETRNLDTIATEDTVNSKKIPKEKPKSIANKAKRILSRSDAVSEEAETETKPLPAEKNESSSKSNQALLAHQDSSSSNSWGNLSLSSNSWEEVGGPTEKDLSKSGHKGVNDILNTESSTAASDKDKQNSQGRSLKASLRVGPGGPSTIMEEGPLSSSAETRPSLKGAVVYGAATLPHPGQSGHKGVSSQSSQSESFEMIDPSAETESVTDSNMGRLAISEQKIQEGENIGKGSGMLMFGVDPEGETLDSTDEMPNYYSANANQVGSQGSQRNNPLPKATFMSSEKTVSVETTDVDPGADTADGWEPIENDLKLPPRISVPHKQASETERNSSVSALERMSSGSSFNYCDSTEEGADDNLNYILNSSQSSNSSFRSWGRSSQFSSSLSDQGSLNSTSSSFVMVNGKTKEQISEARTLEDADYQKLISGVTHDWLVQRLNGTGIFKPSRLNQAYNALLLKYSKKSGLWTAQETVVHIGDYLTVDKPGKQRNAFWIHFLHQDETLGRYVGKEYKKEKEIFYHLNDVERQMTAQYYVTEFNRSLYELSIPTQVFYLPSAVLMIMDGRSVKGCVSVEPYILGEFVKLSNNAKVVRSQYKATEYGMAFGHFTYEFTNRTEIVVDLQGWVTGSEKGEALIYLTDPQIHSLKDVSATTNFGMKGIGYFFNDQHQECNDICSRLSLTRPALPAST
ncbi:alpha-protein kinase 1 [Ambystoma mexicanum]|uniref:alpha-protein kinase 1 n=1 Tax=Ambystoma mexicanum TaxID=8296 RepID=UPI0037E77DC4